MGARSSEQPGATAKRRILLVEDDDCVREIVERALVASGFSVLGQSGGAVALVAARSAGRLDVVVTDLTMPLMSGVDFVAALRKERPGIPVVFISGYAADNLDSIGATPLPGVFLAKPFSRRQLVEAITAALTAAP